MPEVGLTKILTYVATVASVTALGSTDYNSSMHRNACKVAGIPTIGRSGSFFLSQETHTHTQPPFPGDELDDCRACSKQHCRLLRRTLCGLRSNSKYVEDMRTTERWLVCTYICVWRMHDLLNFS